MKDTRRNGPAACVIGGCLACAAASAQTLEGDPVFPSGVSGLQFDIEGETRTFDIVFDERSFDEVFGTGSSTLELETETQIEAALVALGSFLSAEGVTRVDAVVPLDALTNRRVMVPLAPDATSVPGFGLMSSLPFG